MQKRDISIQQQSRIRFSELDGIFRKRTLQSEKFSRARFWLFTILPFEQWVARRKYSTLTRDSHGRPRPSRCCPYS